MPKAPKEAIDVTALLTELLHAHKRSLHAAAREHGLSPQQTAALWHLEPGLKLPMSALAELLMCDASNVTGIVDKLEARDLVRREQGDDRRVKVLTLTKAGDALRETLRATLLAPPPWILGLSRDDQRALRDILQRAEALMRAAGAD
jgi:MarR family transcriptional regulator, organic hydroperoxide resistance regulator